MSEHFRAFSFVDRISPARDDSRIEGCYIIPSGLDDFPSSLVARGGRAIGGLGGDESRGF